MLDICIHYQSSWRNAFLSGDNDQKIFDEKGKVVYKRNYIASMTNLKDEKNYRACAISDSTVMGVLNRLIGDQRRLFQSRQCPDYFFKTIESQQQMTFVDTPEVVNQEIVYLRNLTGSLDQSAFSGIVNSKNAAFDSEFSGALWGILFSDLASVCQFINDEKMTIAPVQTDPIAIKSQYEQVISKLKPIDTDAKPPSFIESLLQAEKRLQALFSEGKTPPKYRNQAGKVLPGAFFCSALYVQLQRLQQQGDEVDQILTKLGNIPGFSKGGFTAKDFMKAYTTGNGKLIYGNPYVREEYLSGEGKVQKTLTKASGSLNIKLDIDDTQAYQLQEMIIHAGVATFYLGKKGLAYVYSMDIY